MGRKPDDPQPGETQLDVIQRIVDSLAMSARRDEAVSQERHIAMVNVLQAIGRQDDLTFDLITATAATDTERWEALLNFITVNQKADDDWRRVMSGTLMSMQTQITAMQEQVTSLQDMVQNVLSQAVVTVALEETEVEIPKNKYGR